MTDTNRIPYGAAEILAARKAGKRPADLLLLSLIGPLRGENNPVLIAQLGREYDWRVLVGLQVLVVSESTQPSGQVRAITEAIKAARPDYLGVWFADKRNGLNFIVGGVAARPRGLLRHMTQADRQRFATIGQRQEVQQCA